MAGVGGCETPNHRVQRAIANSSSPAHRKRVAPVHIGGHGASPAIRNFVPVLLAPHRNTAKVRAAATAILDRAEGTRWLKASGSAVQWDFV